MATVSECLAKLDKDDAQAVNARAEEYKADTGQSRVATVTLALNDEIKSMQALRASLLRGEEPVKEAEPAPKEEKEEAPAADVEDSAINAEAQEQVLKDKGLKVTKTTTAKGKDVWHVTGKGTFDNKDALRELGGKWYGKDKAWTYKEDPTEKIAKRLGEDPESGGGSAGEVAGDDTKAGTDADEDSRLRASRQREDARADDRRDGEDVAGEVSARTRELIYKGKDFGIPEEVVRDQVEDVGMIKEAFNKDKSIFILANEAGTGKTFVLGGAIRELRESGVKKFVYVTMNKDLITQIKKDLNEYGVEDVSFYTYSALSKSVGSGDLDGAVVIFDETHNIKNPDSARGKAGAEFIENAKFSIFASATPFENPVEAGYLAPSGLFDRAGGFVDWAKMYGAAVRKYEYFDYEAGRKITRENVYWPGRGKAKDGAAARQWFFKQGIMTQRQMKIQPDLVDVQFKRETVDQEWVDSYDEVVAVYEAAMNEYRDENGNLLSGKIPSEIARHRENAIKRVLEASKVDFAVARAKQHLKDGKSVVMFVETKAERTLGKWRRSQHFKDRTLYTYPEMQSIMMEWEQEVGMAKAMNEKRPPRPFAEFIYELARHFHEANVEIDLPSTSAKIINELGVENVGVYTGAVTHAKASKAKADFLAGKKKVLVATMAKGGTGLSLHDTKGDRPTVQINLNLPWKATGVDQVSGRIARYGLRSKAIIEWLFAANIAWEADKLAPRVGARMRDMGALVKGLKVKAAEALDGGFDFHGEINVKQEVGEGKIDVEESPDGGASEYDELYRQAEALEKSRSKASDTSGGFFETPFPIAVLMQRLAGVREGDRVLEPSAGTGNLVRLLPDGVSVDAVELRNDNQADLKRLFKGRGDKWQVHSGNFMEEAVGLLAKGDYDVVLMNPPFERLKGEGPQDANHVQTAHDMLAPNGRLVAIMGEGVFFRGYKDETAFRKWLDDVGATVIKLPEDTFKKSGTKVRTRMVVIDKGAESGRADIDLDDTSIKSLKEMEEVAVARDGVEPIRDEVSSKPEDKPTKPDDKKEGKAKLGAAPAWDKGPVELLEEKFAMSPDGLKVGVQYAIVDLGDLVTSHDWEGRENPEYPQEKQIRERGGEGARMTLNKHFNEFEPEVLNKAVQATTGPPIVDGNGVVESGNGRVLLLRKVDTEAGKKSDSYQSMLQEVAPDVDLSKFDSPALVRIRTEEVTDEFLIRFIEDSNKSDATDLSAPEGAARDAKNIPGEALEAYTSGIIDSKQNTRFFRIVAKALLSTSERNAVFNDNGEPAPEFVEKVNNALFLRAFSGSKRFDPLLKGLVSQRNNDMRAIYTAMKSVSGLWSQMRHRVGNGKYAKEYDITQDFLEAVAIVRTANKKKDTTMSEYLEELRMAKQEPSDIQKQLINAIFKDKKLTARRSSKGLATVLQNYTAEVKSQSEPNLFGESGRTDPATVLDVVMGRKDAKLQSVFKGKKTLKPNAAKAIKALLNKIAPQLRGLKIRDSIVWTDENGKKHTIGGEYTPLTDIIGIALDGNWENAVRHEAIHHLRELGLFTEAEWRILTRAAESSWKKKYNVAEEYSHYKNEEQRTEEAIAEANARFQSGELKVEGRIARLFRRIKNFFTRLTGMMKKEGYSTIADIFEAVESGAIGNRAGMRKSGPNTVLQSKYSAAQQSQSKAFMAWAKDKATDISPLGHLPQKEKYLDQRGIAQGQVAKADKTAKKIYDAFRDVGDDAVAVYQYLTNKSGSLSAIKDPTVRSNAKLAKQAIMDMGQKLVDRGLLAKETYEENKGSYLPRLYLKHLLDEKSYLALGTGKKPSDLGYLKRKKDIPLSVRKLIYGEITDPAFLASRGYGAPMRDVALLDWLGEIAENKKWVLEKSFVEWKGKKVTPYWLKSEADRIRMMMQHLDKKDMVDAAKVASDMDVLASKALGDIEGEVPDGFTRFPDTPRYGALRGMYVRKEIHDDIVGNIHAISDDVSVAEKVLGNGGMATKFTQLWKWAKVAANPPAQVRNFISNAMLLHLSGVSFHKVPTRVLEAIRDIKKGGKYWEIAKKYGVTESTFSAQELRRIERDFLDMQAKNHGVFSLAHMKSLGGKLVDATGNIYQMSEAIFKTAKIIDAMEKGMKENEAVREAQKWMFDYSLVNPSVRYLRNAPIGAPFLTFHVKVLPRLLEVVTTAPWRFTPYVAIPMALQKLIASMKDVDDDDVEQLKEALPEWLRERGNAHFMPGKDEHGRWQALDVGYFMPWSLWGEMGKELAKGEIGGAVKTAGIAGGPIPNIISAIQTNTDPFTRKEIVNEFDPPAKQVEALMTYAWRLTMPTFITDIGFAGHLKRALSEHVDRNGHIKSTVPQSLLRLIGINLYPIDPQYTRAENIKWMKYDISKVKRNMRKAVRDRNLTSSERKKVYAQFVDMIKERQERLKDYAKRSKVHPNLR